MHYLGIVIDSVRMELSLPEGKLVKLQGILDSVRDAHYISKKTLESLTGLLNHCSYIVKGGKIFCRRLYDLYKVMCNRHLNRIKIGAAARLDLLWWCRFSKIFNGRGAISNPEFPYPMVSDASRRGFGVYLDTDWVMGTWPGFPCTYCDTDCLHIGPHPEFGSVDYENINVLELWPVLIGLKRWFSVFSHHSVVIYTDNTQVKGMLTKSSSINKTCMNWLREIYWLCVIYHIQLVPRYVSTTDNVTADALSRLSPTASTYKEALSSSNLCCIANFTV